jgi:hypothetical protein
MVRVFPFLLLLVAVLPGCDGEDPKIRQEVAELRTQLGDLERKNARLEADLKEARSKATLSNFLGREALGRNLQAVMPELRANLTRAFPNLTVDPVSPGTISTPLDEQGFPYNTELSFGLSQGAGRGVTTYTINIKADREGKWHMPDLRALAALQEHRSADNGQPTRQGGGPSADGPRVIDWGEQNTGAAPAPAPAPPPSQPAPAAPSSRPNQPEAQAPFPVQDSRTIQFD